MKWLSQVFERTASKKLLTIGLASLLIGSLVALYTNVRFVGIMDITTPETPVAAYPFLDNIFNTALLALLLFLLGLWINPKTRFIDILNIAFICRIPFYFLSLLNINNLLANTSKAIVQNISNPDNLAQTLQGPNMFLLLFLFTSASIVSLVLFGAVIYKGFKIATNLKKTTHIFSLIITVLIAEYISKYFVYLY